MRSMAGLLLTLNLLHFDLQCIDDMVVVVAAAAPFEVMTLTRCVLDVGLQIFEFSGSRI